MIPKIINYCWFGHGRKSKEIERYINTWKIILPDYQIIEWNESNFPYEKWKFCREAYAVKSYAFVADVCRLYALNEMGGIYLDTDVEVLRDFDDFLHEESFIGEEAEGKYGTACIGAEKSVAWIKDFLHYYDNRHFVKWNGRLLNYANTDILKIVLKQSRSLPTVYPIDFFCAKFYNTNELLVTENTRCIHHYSASWIKPLTIKGRLCNLYHRIMCGFKR